MIISWYTQLILWIMQLILILGLLHFLYPIFITIGSILFLWIIYKLHWKKLLIVTTFLLIITNALLGLTLYFSIQEFHCINDTQHALLCRILQIAILPLIAISGLVAVWSDSRSQIQNYFSWDYQLLVLHCCYCVSADWAYDRGEFRNSHSILHIFCCLHNCSHSSVILFNMLSH